MRTGAAPAIAAAIDRALEFLTRGQLPSGQFRIEHTDYKLVDPATRRPPVTPDEAPFATAHIAHSLSFSPRPAALAMIARAVAYLRREQLDAGVWRHWNKGSPRHRIIPPDADDTACISDLLARLGGGAPDNEQLLLLNRDRRGLFYTWLIPRPIATANVRYWRLVLGDLNVPRVFGLWRRTPARRGDVDAIVNANVLLYLGNRPETEPVIAHLLQIVREGREEQCDKWYTHRYAFYYAVSRAYARGIRGLEAVREPARERLAERAGPGGRIGEHELHTALAACALMSFGAGLPLLDGAVDHLMRTQQRDGGWRSWPFYYGGPGTAFFWGSRELTTGFCVEALERYRAGRATPA